MRLNHLGIASLDIEKTKRSMQVLYPGAEAGETVYDPLQQAFLCLVKISDGTVFEIVCSEQAKKIARSGFCVYHICMETVDFDGTMKKWLLSGYDLIAAPKPAVLFGGRRVAFWRTETGLVELLEAKSGEQRENGGRSPAILQEV